MTFETVAAEADAAPAEDEEAPAKTHVVQFGVTLGATTDKEKSLDAEKSTSAAFWKGYIPDGKRVTFGAMISPHGTAAGSLAHCVAISLSECLSPYLNVSPSDPHILLLFSQFPASGPHSQPSPLYYYCADSLSRCTLSLPLLTLLTLSLWGFFLLLLRSTAQARLKVHHADRATGCAGDVLVWKAGKVQPAESEIEIPGPSEALALLKPKLEAGDDLFVAAVTPEGTAMSVSFNLGHAEFECADKLMVQRLGAEDAATVMSESRWFELLTQ